MIDLEYNVAFDVQAIAALENRVLTPMFKSMQQVVDALVENIQHKFGNPDLADTVVGTTYGKDLPGSQFEITGTVTSTWPAMIWYEKGRPPGGKMPPVQAIHGWAVRKGIQPDPVRTMQSFAIAINVLRARANKKKVPLDVLVEWATNKGIVPSQEFAVDSMAFAMAKKIQRDGLPGHHHFAQGLEETKPFINQSFENVVIASYGL